MRRKAINAGLLLLPSALIIVIFFAMMGAMVRASFAPGGAAGMVGSGFTLDNYGAFLGSDFYREYLTHSLWISFYCTIISAVLGYVIAYFMYRSGPGIRMLVGTVLIVQFFTAYVIRTYAVMLVIGRTGLLNQTLLALGITDEPLRLLFTETGVAIGLVQVSLPFMVFPILAALQAIPPNVEMASASLGARGLRTFWQVIFPLSLPGVAAGIIIVYLFQLTSYIVPGLLGGGYSDMIANLIYKKAMQSFEYTFAAAAAVITLIVAALLIFALQKGFGRLLRHIEGRI